MRLSTFQDPIFSTVQGEGCLVGTPSTFVRLQGCDFRCKWCDTKGSWETDKGYINLAPSDVADAVEQCPDGYVVFTGGNPMLQVEELMATINILTSRRGQHITVETQGSIYDERAVDYIDLLSLSPKLDRWSECNVPKWLTYFHSDRIIDMQLKVVVQSLEEVDDAFHKLLQVWNVSGSGRLYLFLQPEYGQGVRFIRDVMRRMYQLRQRTGRGHHIRLLPQIHKTVLKVP